MRRIASCVRPKRPCCKGFGWRTRRPCVWNLGCEHSVSDFLKTPLGGMVCVVYVSHLLQVRDASTVFRKVRGRKCLKSEQHSTWCSPLDYLLVHETRHSSEMIWIDNTCLRQPGRKESVWKSYYWLSGSIFYCFFSMSVAGSEDWEISDTIAIPDTVI